MHSRRRLFEGLGVRVVDFRCRSPVSSCGGEEPAATHQIVVVRRGLFTCSDRRGELVADANQILFFNAGRSHRYAHPLPGGDDCTILELDAECAHRASERLPRDAGSRCRDPFPLGHAPSSRDAAWRHLELLAALSATAMPSRLAVQEIVVDLFDAALLALHEVLCGAAERPQVSRWARERVEEAKVVLGRSLDAPPSLVELAAELECSPFHLSRIFSAVTGVGLRHYLRRLRCRLAADRLLRGSNDLTELALALGFYDHSHFTNAFRREWGVPPSRLLAAVAHAG